MGKRRPAPRPDPGNPSHEDAVWVTSDLAPTGVYICTVHVGDTILGVLAPDEAMRYCAAWAANLSYAEHDAAVIAQLRHAGITDLCTLAGVIGYLRENRPPPPLFDPNPLTVDPIVSARTNQPILVVRSGDNGWQWEPRDVHQHIRHVLEVSAGVDLDSHYRQALVSFIGLEDGMARAMVTSLAKFRGGN